MQIEKYVYVDVDLDDFDEDDLVSHLVEKGYTVFKNDAASDSPLDPIALWEALRYRRDGVEEVKRRVMDATGRLL